MKLAKPLLLLEISGQHPYTKILQSAADVHLVTEMLTNVVAPPQHPVKPTTNVGIQSRKTISHKRSVVNILIEVTLSFGLIIFWALP
jgi:hypothetical protein